jgi:hypothetical protein
MSQALVILLIVPCVAHLYSRCQGLQGPMCEKTDLAEVLFRLSDSSQKFRTRKGVTQPAMPYKTLADNKKINTGNNS